jgi:glycosyltransferase involved in cell wall biosynthesis
MPEPLVSVVITTFNRPDYLKLALASAVNQTYRKLEIIVQDNHSSTDPRSIVEAFDDPRIRYYRNDENIGLTRNMLHALGRAGGEFVAHLCDDDVWDPEFIAELVAPLMENPDAVVAFCDHHIIDFAGKIDPNTSARVSQYYGRAGLREGFYSLFFKLALVDQAISSASAALFRNGVIDWAAISPECGHCLDLHINYAAAKTHRLAYYRARKLVRYRVHEASASNAVGTLEGVMLKARSRIYHYTTLHDDPELAEYRRHFFLKRAYAVLFLAGHLLRAKCLKEALGIVFEGWRTGLLDWSVVLPAVRRACLLSYRNTRQELSLRRLHKQPHARALHQ